MSTIARALRTMNEWDVPTRFCSSLHHSFVDYRSSHFLVEHRYPSGFAFLLVLHASFGQFLVGCRALIFEHNVKASYRFYSLVNIRKKRHHKGPWNPDQSVPLDIQKICKGIFDLIMRRRSIRSVLIIYFFIKKNYIINPFIENSFVIVLWKIQWQIALYPLF